VTSASRPIGKISPASPPRPGRAARIAILLFVAAEVARTLADENTQGRLGWYAGLTAFFLVFFLLTLGRPPASRVLQHVYLAAQSAAILAMVAPDETDAVTALFAALAFQAAQFFVAPALWFWVGTMSLLTVGSLTALRGIEGLALAMSPIAGIIAVPAFMVASQQVEAAQDRSRALLAELESAHGQLRAHAEQVEELSALKERNRLARELHDTVSQYVFSIVLTVRSAQVLRDEDAPRLPELLERLQVMTGSALSQLRTLISQMRP
jgi:signal transduction histidine kinase